MKMTLLNKLLIIFFLFTLGVGSAICFVTTKNYKKVIYDRYYEKAKTTSKLSASVIDGELVKKYATTLEKDENYEKILEELNNIKKQTNAYYLYVMYPISDEKGIYIFDTELTEEQAEDIGDSEAADLGYNVEFYDENGNDNFASARQAISRGEISDKLEVTETLQGSKMQVLGSVYAPIKDEAGNNVAFVGVDVSIDDIESTTKDAIVSLIRIIALVAIIFFILIITVVKISVVKPINELKAYAERIYEGTFGEQINVRGRDEISEIANVFNKMSTSIGNHMNEVNQINDAYHKYVPSEIFEILKKKEVTEMRLGDQVMTNLAVMSANIINFSEVTRTMDSEEMFGFINRILNPVVPYVGEKQGVIENYKNCGFLVFQRNSCEKLLEAAILMSKKFIQIIKEEKNDRILFGMSISYGEVMLGTVGNEDRMANVSVSEQNSVCEYLSSCQDKYYSHILITASAVAQIENFEEKFSNRCVGYLYVSANEQTEKLYDVYEGDSDDDRRLKDQTKDVFEKGINYYCTRDFDRARTCFADVLKVFNRDRASREYLYRCNQMIGKESVEDINIYAEIY